MQLIDANKAQQGMTIVAQSQAAGKGQRGKVWTDTPGQSLLMSIIAVPGRAIQEQFVFNASVAAAIANVLQNLHKDWQIHVKWPNDIIINDKKAGGILIENVLRGNKWAYCVIGLGLNVKQLHFPDTLPFATSLKIASGNDVNMVQLRGEIRESILLCTVCPPPADKIMARYNELLYKRDQKQSFSDATGKWDATLVAVHTDGTLEVQLPDGTIAFYHHGMVTWEWQ